MNSLNYNCSKHNESVFLFINGRNSLIPLVDCVTFIKLHLHTVGGFWQLRDAPGRRISTELPEELVKTAST